MRDPGPLRDVDGPRWASPSARQARLGFVDVDRATRLLGPHELGLLDVAGAPVDPPAGTLVDAIAVAADPDLAVLTLARLVETPLGEEIGAAVRTDEVARDRLLAVIGTSTALGEHLVRHPADWRLLTAATLLTTRPTAATLRRTLLDTVPGGDDALRAAYRRLLLGLAARDLCGAVEVDDVTAELADLAAAALSACLALAAAELPADAEPCRFAVLGMGKCGGRELNYVSDVDVVFVAEPLPGGDETAALVSATTLATGLMRAAGTMGAGGAENALWPVDAALRPEGRNGPLVRTLASYRAYYERWARTWEFQALLKARPVAGDVELGAEAVDALAPLVWRAGERPDFVADVRAMRQRVEASVGGRDAAREIKLGRGGLRDVEFAVQLLQLVHGRTDPSLRAAGTLPALAALAAGGYVGREDARQLADSYRWLRRLEHRLQLRRLHRTHVLPADPDELRWLARSLGYRSGRHGDAVAEFDRDRSRHNREVRRLHEKLFYRPLLESVARLPADTARLGERLSRPSALARLAALGFADPEAAWRHLEELANGVSRRAAIQRTLLPAMLPAFADAADPDAGLLAYRRVSEELGRTPWYLRSLRDEGAAATRLAAVLAGSRWIADLLVRAPQAVALLGDDDALLPRPRAEVEPELRAVVSRHTDEAAAVIAVRALRRQELVRIGCADLLGLVEVEQVMAGLSATTASTVAAALAAAGRRVARHRGEELPTRLAVIAMGRLGGGEQGYGSDADVLFVVEPLEGASEREALLAGHAVAEETRRLLALPAPDPELRLDTDLRPEGRAGPLVRTLTSYAAYYRRWSAGWESQALLRAVPLAGDAELGQEFVELIEPLRWPVGGLPDSEVREIRRIKARVEAERLPRGADRATHLKLGPGGLADVEWTVQLVQLRHAGRIESLRTTSTLAALTAATEAGLLDAGDVATLRTAWLLASRIRNAIVLVRGRPSDSVPPGGPALAGVARVLNYAPGQEGELLEDYRRATRHARAVVERVFYA